MGITPAGPAYWATNFGLNNFDEFYAAVQPFWPDIGTGPAGTTKAAFQIDYQDPYSAPGIYDAARLQAAGYTPETKQATGGLFQQLLGAAAVVRQEQTTMPQLIIPGAFQVTIQAVNGTRAVDNVIGVTNSGGTAAGAAAAVKAAWEGCGIFGALPQNYGMKNYHAVDLSSANGSIADLPSNKAATLAQIIATAAACCLWQWNGSTRSRSTRGRMYVGPLPATDLQADGRSLTAAAQASFQGNLNSFLAALNTAGYPLAVLSRKQMVAHTVTAGTCESTIATQRRRLR